MLSSLNHPNIVKVVESFETPEFFYYVMEYVESGSLASVIKRFGNLPEALLKNYTKQLLTGLKYLHGNGVTHYDIKGRNVLITKDGVIKLADFGSASSAEFVVGSESIAGSPNWMAPEVIQLEPSTTAADIWSCGCTLVELLTGAPPYASVPPMNAVYKIATDGITEAFLAGHFEEYLPGQQVSLELMDFLLACFALVPAERPDAATLLEHQWLGPSSAAPTMDLEEVGRAITAAAQQRAALSLTMKDFALFIDASADLRRGIRFLVESAELRESGLRGQELLEVGASLYDIYFEPGGVFGIPQIAHLRQRLRAATRDEELFDVIAEAKEIICQARQFDSDIATTAEAEAEAWAEAEPVAAESASDLRQSEFDVRAIAELDPAALDAFKFDFSPGANIQDILAVTSSELELQLRSSVENRRYDGGRATVLLSTDKSPHAESSRGARGFAPLTSDLIAPDFPISNLWSPKSSKGQKKLQKLHQQLSQEKQKLLDSFEKEADNLAKRIQQECEEVHRSHDRTVHEVLSRQQFQLGQLSKRQLRDQESRRKDFKKDVKTKRGRQEELQVEYERQSAEDSQAYQQQVKDILRTHASEVQVTKLQQLQEVHTYDLAMLEEINRLHFSQQARYFHLIEQQIRVKAGLEMELAKEETEEASVVLLKTLREQGHGLLDLSDTELNQKMLDARGVEEKLRSNQDVSILLENTRAASLDNARQIRSQASTALRQFHEEELEKISSIQREEYEQSLSWEQASPDASPGRRASSKNLHRNYMDKASGFRRKPDKY